MAYYMAYVTAYHGNPYVRYCVQWKITSPNADPGPPPAGKIPNPNPQTAAGRPRKAFFASSMSSKVNDAAPLKRPLERWRSSMFVGAMSCSLKAFLNKASVFKSKGRALTLTTREAWRRAWRRRNASFIRNHPPHLHRRRRWG